jgi:hypothetical protein
LTLSTRQLQQTMTALRTTAEQDPSDVIANRASDLAWRLEAAGTNVFAISADPKNWQPWEREMVRYAMKPHTKVERDLY